MKFHDSIPEFETDEEYDNWMGDGRYYLEYKSWRVLESVDSLLHKHGLQIEIWGDDADAPFGITTREA